MGINLVAALWGFAEATLFFIVPDVWLSLVARKKLKIGVIACFYSLFAALAGGILLYFWGCHEFANASQIIEKVPAVSHAMLLRVGAELSQQGPQALILGPLSGTPYKVYALQAANAGISLWLFILISIPARLIRFLLVVSISHYAVKFVARFNTKISSWLILIISWLIFYACYFYFMISK